MNPMKRFGLYMTMGAMALGLVAAGCSETPLSTEEAAASSARSSDPMSKIRQAPLGKKRVANSYIVVLKPNVSDPTGILGEMANAEGVKADNVYKNTIKGFSARLSARQ